mgnify:CR=1 FL=1
MDIATLAGQLGIQLTAEAVTTIVNRLDKKEKKDKKKITDQELTYLPKTQYNELVSQAYTCIQYNFSVTHRFLRHFNVYIYLPLGKKVSTSHLQTVVAKIFLWFSFVSKFPILFS